MHKRYLVSAGVVLILSTGYSQIQVFGEESKRISSTPNTSNNTERYGVDYKLVNESILQNNPAILNDINLDELEQYRSKTEDVTVIDPNTGLSLILFYKKRVKLSNEPNPLNSEK